MAKAEIPLAYIKPANDFNATIAKNSDAKSAKPLRALCVPSALFALKHTLTPRFNAKVAKALDAKSAKTLRALCVLLRAFSRRIRANPL